MAKSVLELAVGTGQWDAGLKKAKSALDNFTQSQGGLQQALAKDSENIRKFVSMMGQTESTAKTAKGQMNDYKSTIEQLTMQYNRMTEAQKNSIGQDYIQSISQLKQKYQAVNEEIQEMNRSLNNVKAPDVADGTKAGGLFGGGKLDGMLQVFGGNLMTKAAGAVAQLGSEMYGMVQQGIELAKQGEGIRIAFERLGRGDILDGLRQATHGTVTDLELMKAAVKFNDFKLPLDQLGTMLAFAQQKAKDTGQDVNYLVDSIVTGLGRKSLMILDNLGLSATEIKEKMKETGDMTKAVGAIIRDQMAKAGDYVETAADRAAQANVSLQNKMEELGRKFAPIEEASNQLWTSMKIGILDIVGGPLARLLNGLTEAGRMRNALNDMGGNDQVDNQLGKLRVAKAAGSGYMTRSLYNQQVEQYNRQINTSSQQLKDIRAWQSGERGEALQGRIGVIRDKYGSLDATKVKAEIDATKYMLAQYRQGAQQIMNATSSTKGGTTTTGGNKKDTKTEQTELQKNQAKINELTQEFVKLGDESTEASRERQAEIQKEIELLQKRNGLLGLRAEQAQGRMTLGAGDFQRDGLSNTPGTLLKAPDTAIPSGGLQLSDKAMNAVQKNIDKQMKDVGKIGDEWSGVASAIGAVGNAMSGIEDPAAKVLGIVAQAIATVALTFSKSLAGTVTPWDWIAAAAAGTATMISTISAIHSATGFANGGVVPGFANGGMIDSGHSPSFLSFSKAAPAFATGGVVPQTFTSMPKFATGGIVQKFNEGGTVEAGHAPDFLSFSKAMPKFATGGTIPHANGGYFVGGTHYSSDVTPIMANAGELVLNKAQQGNLASQLQGGGMQNLNLTATIKGEQIRLALNNNGRRTGRGEYVQSRNVR